MRKIAVLLFCVLATAPKANVLAETSLQDTVVVTESSLPQETLRDSMRGLRREIRDLTQGREFFETALENQATRFATIVGGLVTLLVFSFGAASVFSVQRKMKQLRVEFTDQLELYEKESNSRKEEFENMKEKLKEAEASAEINIANLRRVTARLSFEGGWLAEAFYDQIASCYHAANAAEIKSGPGENKDAVEESLELAEGILDRMLQQENGFGLYTEEIISTRRHIDKVEEVWKEPHGDMISRIREKYESFADAHHSQDPTGTTESTENTDHRVEGSS